MTAELALAMAIIRGDRIAARAAAEMVLEQDQLSYDELEAIRAQRRSESRPLAGYELYGTPEFKAFLRLLGVSWEGPTICMTIHIPAEGLVRVTQQISARIQA